MLRGPYNFEGMPEMNKKMHFKDKIAFITGGSRGIGNSIALALAKAGISVALTYKDNKELAEEAVKKIIASGGEAFAVKMLAESSQSIKDAIKKARQALGPISILVNNAAISQEKPFQDLNETDWDYMLAVNLKGPFLCSQESVSDMQKLGWGRIINISSIGGQLGGTRQVHYAVSKAGLICLTRSLARIYSVKGITVNAVAPGLVDTDMSSQEIKSEFGKEKIKNIPIGRIATVQEIANVVVFLASDAAGYITGQTINVNGGMYLG